MREDLKAGCYSCEQQAKTDPPPREDIAHTEHWRVAHVFNSTLPGWLVILPARHIEAFTELTSSEADQLGGLIRELSVALTAVTGCVKTYVMQFSEAEGFSHLHVHLVPRMADQPTEARGPGVFVYLTPDESRWISGPELDALALQLRAELSAHDSSPR